MRVLSLTLLFACLLMPSLSFAQSNIAVVDVHYILSNAKASKSVQKQRGDLQDKFLAEIAMTEKTLLAEEQALMKEREELDADAFLKKKQDYERKLLETGKQVREKKQAFDVILGEAMNTLQSKITDIAQTIAVEKSYDLIISKKSVLTGSEKLDITQDILKRLDTEIPDIKLKTP